MRSVHISILQIGLLLVGNAATADEGATLKGRLVVPAKWAEQVHPNSVELELVEEIPIEQPPLPGNWGQLTADEKSKWMRKFRESQTGILFLQQQEKRRAAARKFKVAIEPDGAYTIYDVPPAVYSFQGQVDFKSGERNFIAEVYGQIEVVKEADEVLLGDLELTVSAVLSSGQPAPDFQLKTIDNETISLAKFRGKTLLINFWSVASPPAAKFQLDVQQIVTNLNSGHAVELLAISLDEDENSVLQFAKDNNLTCVVGIAKGWGDPIVTDFGLNAIPSLWLIDSQGTLVATDRDLGVALRDSGMSLEQILTALIDGKPIPTKPADSPPKDSPANEDKL